MAELFRSALDGKEASPQLLAIDGRSCAKGNSRISPNKTPRMREMGFEDLEERRGWH